MNESALDRFLRYAKIDTQSKDDVEEYPSTRKQLDLLNLLLKELKDLGLKDARIDKYGYVMATVPSNIPQDHTAHGKVPTHRVHRACRHLPFRQRRKREAAGDHIQRRRHCSSRETIRSLSGRRRTRN